jgi:hypothetical protein
MVLERIKMDNVFGIYFFELHNITFFHLFK